MEKKMLEKRADADKDEEVYEICVKCVMDDRWSAWFEDFQLLHATDSETTFIGKIKDSERLFTFLGKIRDLGIPLLSDRRDYKREDGIKP
jgi:hypothetical protein